MMRLSLVDVSFCAYMTLSAAGVLACEEYFDHSRQEVLAEAKTMRDREKDGFERVLAFEQLMCDRRETVRAMALQAAKESGFAPLTGRYVEEVMFQKSVVVVVLERTENLSREAYEIINKYPLIDFDINMVDRQRKCISTSWNRGTCAGEIFSINGNKVQLSAHDWRGSFEFEGNSNLSGFMSLDKAQHKIPARIPLN